MSGGGCGHTLTRLEVVGLLASDSPPWLLIIRVRDGDLLAILYLPFAIPDLYSVC